MRKKELLSIRREFPVVLMDTPYRLFTLLKDIMDILGSETYVILCMDLTTDTEEILRGRIDEIMAKIKDKEKKREFVLIIKPKGKIPEHE